MEKVATQWLAGRVCQDLDQKDEERGKKERGWMRQKTYPYTSIRDALIQ
jgi:hypothetical protein